MDKVCCLKECDRRLYAKGFCEMHYQRLKKHGSPIDNDRSHAPPEVRFWRKVEKFGPEGCWIYRGSHTKNGYGRFQIGGKGSQYVGAHRYSYELATGERPEVVMHTCDNPFCVNPAHLRAGTYAENTADMYAKGRAKPGRALGNRNYNTKLTPEDVRAIRQRQGESANSVGRDFGVDHKAILAIWRGITWTHIT